CTRAVPYGGQIHDVADHGGIIVLEEVETHYVGPVKSAVESATERQACSAFREGSVTREGREINGRNGNGVVGRCIGDEDYRSLQRVAGEEDGPSDDYEHSQMPLHIHVPPEMSPRWEYTQSRICGWGSGTVKKIPSILTGISDSSI